MSLVFIRYNLKIKTQVIHEGDIIAKFSLYYRRLSSGNFPEYFLDK